MSVSRDELTVRQVMEPNPAVVPPGAPVQDVLRLMTTNRIGSVLVVDHGRLEGIFTERDLLKKVTTVTPPWRDLPVSGWMTPDPFTIGPDAGWDEAAGLMSRLRIRHLPVVRNGDVLGIVSSRMLMARREEHLSRKVAERTAELRRANDLLLARDADMARTMRAAGRLQTRLLLPPAPIAWPELGWAVHFTPLDHLGGDYYDFATPAPDRLGFLIADASGHSLPAAMVAIMARFAFAQASPTNPDPGAVLAALNRRLVELADDERFVTAFYGVFDRTARVLRYATAGHPPQLWYDARAGRARELAGQGFLLGVMPDEVYATREVALSPGDRLCFYTDGLVEARNEIGEMFGTDRLTRCVEALGKYPAAELLAGVLDAQRAFSGSAKLTDDLTLAVAEVV
jgi:serine phosphatase RsbU (regulator of sigma subunit)/CBS domain-containing protein